MGISAQVFSALHQLVLNPKFFSLVQPEPIFYPVRWLQGALKMGRMWDNLPGAPAAIAPNRLSPHFPGYLI